MGAKRALTFASAKSTLPTRSRRRLLFELGVLTASLGLPACQRPRERTAVLHDLVSEVVARDVEHLTRETRRLDLVVEAFAERADAAAAAEARDALKRALLVWKQASAFRAGPLADKNVFVRAMFWPIRPSAIDQVLDAERPVDEAVVEQLGVNQKGLYALEYVLFARARGTNQDYTEQERRFARQVSANVLGYAERGRLAFGDGRDYAQSFADSGQDGVAKLAELTTDAVEIVFGKLDRVSRHTAGAGVGPAEVEGYFSKSSLDVALALLAGAEALFVGAGAGGLGALVGAVSAPVEARVKAEFGSARERLRLLGAPLERSCRENPARFRAAAAGIRTLERTLKLEVASALGLSLVFGSGDGD